MKTNALLFIITASVIQITVSASAQTTTLELTGAGSSLAEPIGKVLAANQLYTVAGRPNADGNKGMIHIYETATGKELRRISGATAGDKFGAAVAMRGTEVIVGSPGAGSGFVQFFDIPTGRLLKNISPTSGGGAFGYSLACDGDYVIIGVPEWALAGGVSQGKAQLLKIPVGQSSAGAISVTEIFPSDSQDDAFYGYSVAIRGDIIAVGAPFHDQAGAGNCGKVYLHQASRAGTTFEFDSHIESVPVANDNFGWAVALTPTYLVVGTPYSGGNDGSVDFIRLRTGGGRFRVSDAAAGNFGSSLAASETHVVVGAPKISVFGGPQNGAIRVYLNPPDYTPTAAIPLSDTGLSSAAASALTGSAVAIAGDRLIVGIPGKNQMVIRSGYHSLLGFGTPLTDQFHKGSTVPTFPSTSGRVVNMITQAGAPLVGVFGGSPYNDALVRCTASLPGSTKPSSVAMMASNGAGPLGFETFFFSGSSYRTTDFFDPLSNSTNYFGFMSKGVTVSSGAPIQHLNIVSYASSYSAASVESGADLGFFKLKSFGSPRHGTIPGFEYFLLPATYSQKPGGIPVTAANDTGISFFTPVGTEVFQVREGATVSPYGGLLLGQMNGRCAFERRHLVFSSFLQGAAGDEDSCVLSYAPENGLYSNVAREGSEAPGTGGASFSAFLGETSNDVSGGTSNSLFRATLRGTASPALTAANNEGLWSNRAGAGPVLIFRKGGNPDNVFPSGVTIARFLRYWISNSGSVCALVGLSGRGVTAANDVALIESKFISGVTQRLREGSAAPGLGSATIGVISTVDARQSGYWTALCTLAVKAGAATAANNQALFTGNDLNGAPGQARLRLRKGARVDRTGSEVIRSITLSNKIDDGRSGALAIGMGHVISDFAAVTTILTYDDGFQVATSVNP